MVYFSFFGYKVHKIWIYLILSSVASFWWLASTSQWNGGNSDGTGTLVLLDQIGWPSPSKSLPDYGLPLGWHFWESGSKRDCMMSNHQIPLHVDVGNGGARTYFTFSAVCAIITSDSLLVHACKDTPWISSWKVWKKWRIKFLLTGKIAPQERPPRRSANCFFCNIAFRSNLSAILHCVLSKYFCLKQCSAWEWH